MEHIKTFLMNFNLEGLCVGLTTFLIIGLFHPLVIKGEYYLGAAKSIVAFSLLGIIFLILALLEPSTILSSIYGITSFSSFWSILEVKQQVKRVKRGWYPSNPKRDSKQSSQSM